MCYSHGHKRIPRSRLDVSVLRAIAPSIRALDLVDAVFMGLRLHSMGSVGKWELRVCTLWNHNILEMEKCVFCDFISLDMSGKWQIKMT